MQRLLRFKQAPVIALQPSLHMDRYTQHQRVCRLTKVVEGDVEFLYVDEHWSFGNSDHLFVTWDTHRPTQSWEMKARWGSFIHWGSGGATHEYRLALWDVDGLSRDFRFQLHSWADGHSCPDQLFARERELCQELYSLLLLSTHSICFGLLSSFFFTLISPPPGLLCISPASRPATAAL